MSENCEISVTENTTGPIVDLDCGEGANPDAGKDICALTDKNANAFGEDTDKPTSYTLSLGDTLTDEIDSSQGDKLEVSAVHPGDDGDGSYYILVSDDEDPSKLDKVYFSGDVGTGQSFTANGIDGKFGSETFVHIFSSDGGTLLQTINFHTSCSAPLVIGDQYGSVSLEGASLVGKDTGTVYEVGGTSAPGDEGVTYEIKAGPGSDLFEVNADGEVSFKEAPDFENPQGLLDADGNSTNNYEVVVLATLEDGTVTEKPLEFCVEDDCIKVTENTTGPIVDLDCGEGANPDAGKDICALTDKNANAFGEDTDKPTSYTLSLGDTLTDEIDSSQGDKLEVSAVHPGDDGDGSYYILVSDDEDPSKLDKVYFSGDVGTGQSFTANGIDGKFGSETFVHIFSSDGGTLLQTINFHTSCSAPLVIGDQYGSVSLEGASLVGKDTGTVYEVGGTSAPGDEGVTYEIKAGPGSDLFEVNADGEVSFKEAPDFENPQGLLDADGNSTNNYEVVVLATLEDGTVTEKPLEFCVEDDCIKVTENTTGPIVDLDCGEGANPDAGKDICALTDKNANAFGEDTDKPTSYTLSLGDTLTDEIDSSQGDKLEVSAVHPGDDGDGSYYILVSDDEDPSKLDKVYFSGDVGTGQSFTANGIDGKFGSETFVHIFSSDGGTLLQTINFHTSCSAPLVIGDQYGSVSLEGASLVGKDTGTVYEVGGTSAPGDEGVTYEIKAGPGSDLFEVNADGEVSFKEAPDFENPQGLLDADGNSTNNYEVVVLATLEDGTVTEKPLEFCVEDQDCIKILENTDPGVLADLDCEEQEPQNPDQGLDLCMERDALNDAGVDAGKIASVTLTLGDDLTTDSSTDQGGKLEVGPILGAEDGDGQLFVRVSDDDDPDKTDTVYFQGAVGFGQSFTALASNAGDSEFGSETYVHIFDDGGALLQTINFHTSCSAPIALGDQYGSVTLDGGALLNKDTGGVIEYGGSVPREVVYEITGGDGFDPTTGTSPFFDVDPDTGEVTLAFTPDFENPLDDNGDNNYFVEVTGFLLNADGSREICEVKPVEICIEDVVELGSIAGRYFCDLDGDGLDNNNGDEPAEAGVRVFLQLRDAAGNISFVADTVTDANGDYVFEDLPAGEYRVIFAPVAGKVFVDPNVGQMGDMDPADDSDVVAQNPFTGRGATDFIQLADGEDRTDVDAGVEFTASLGDKVFLDADRDGIQDAGEAGVAGVTVTLTGAGADGMLGTADDTTEGDVTDANGEYLFEGLTPGEAYKVTFDLSTATSEDPADIEFTAQDAGGDDDIDSDADPANGMTDPVVLAPGETNTSVDAGVVLKLGSLSGRYFCDTNDNAVDDGQAVDPGVARVLVTLLDANGAPVLDGAGNSITTTTDSLGNYSFGGLEPGTYGVQFDDQPDGQGGTVLAGKVLVDPNVDNQTTPEGTGDEIDSDAVGDTETSTITGIVVTPGDETADNDAGAEKTASLGDFVFEDDNADGIQDTGEAGIGDVGVTLTGGGDDGLISTAGDNDTFTTTTDSTGFYQFTGLNPGEEYQVSFDTPAGFVPSPVDAGTDDAVDSDGDPADGLKTDIVTLTSGETNPTIDQGFYELASLGDRVFEDTNGDGIQGDPADEPGVDNVTVKLFKDGADTGQTTTTDANGAYSFTGLVPGTYSVMFVAPAGFAFTTANAAGVNDALDSDANPANGMTDEITLSSGEFNGTLDAGLVQTASLGDFVFEDTDADGIQDTGEAGIGDVGVTLTGGGDDGLISTAGDNDTFTTTTDSTGFYQFTGLNPGEEYQVSFDTPAGFVPSPVDAGTDDAVDSDGDPADGLKTDIVTLTSGETNPTIDQGFYELASLGDRVFEDTNGDGIQGDPADEPGVDNVTVKLFKDGADTGQTTTTDANGAYSFTGLVPGTYSVMFVAPAGFAFTTANAAGVNDALDSDANPANGMTDEITLSSGEFNGTLDAGLVQTASLGDFVFEDTDADGIQDTGEAGIGDVGVTLTGGGDDGLISTAGDNDTFTTTTDSTGFYQFTGLNPGEEYQVSFDTPAGFVPSPVDAGTDDAVDSDGDPADGLKTDIVTLTSGETNPTIDQGFYELASLGDRVFEDTNGDGIQGDPADEPGVDNVTVKLFKDGADTGQTTTTDANGAYSFTGLVPGTYSVMFVAPAGFAFTTANAAGVNDALDSDANPANGMTDEITLSSGEFNGTLDAGLVQTNNPPAPEPDVTKFCADDITGVDVLANDTDPDGDALSIVTVGGIAPDTNGQVLLSGTAIVDRDGTVSSESFTGLSVTVQGDNLVIDADAAFAFLDIGDEAEVSISYSVSDGNGGTGSTELVATICGEANSLASLVDSLPDTLTYEVVVQGGGFAAPSAFELKVLGPAGSPLEGVVFEQAYCLSLFENVPADGLFDGSTLLKGNTVNPEPFAGSALDGTRGSDLGARTGNTDVSMDAAENLDFINWILAEEFHLQDNGDGGNETYTEYEVQVAIWEFTDSKAGDFGGNGIAQAFDTTGNGVMDGPNNQSLGTVENVNEIVEAALANGNDFEAGDGDVASFIIDPTNPSSNEQPFIVAFNYDEYDCIC